MRTRAGIGRFGTGRPVPLRARVGGQALVLALIALTAGAPPAPAHKAQPPTALLHRFPLNPVQSPSSSPSQSPASGSTPAAGSRPARPHFTRGASPGRSSGLIWPALAAAAAVLLLGASAIGRKRRGLRASDGDHRTSGPSFDEVMSANSTASAEIRPEAACGGAGEPPRAVAEPSPVPRPVLARQSVQSRHGPEIPTAADFAEREYRRADGLGDATGAFNLGAVLHRRGELAGAMSAYQRAEERGDPNAAFNLGVLRYETGDLDGAAAAWRRCVGRGHPKAAANLGHLLQRRGDLEGARAAYHAAASWGDARGASLAAALNGIGADPRPNSTPQHRAQ